MPPTAETTAKRMDHTTSMVGRTVILLAAAVGVMSRESTSRAPTSWTAMAVVRPSSTMKRMDRVRIGTPRARATSGSTEAKNNGRQMNARTAVTSAATAARVVIWVDSIATICPASRPNLLDDRPSYRLRKSIPIPNPNGNMTPIEALRSLARTPSIPRMTAATSEPATAPPVTDAPKYSATEAPAKDSSEVPCTAKARSLAWIIGPMNPETTPRMSPAMIEPVTSGTRVAKSLKLMIVEKSMLSAPDSRRGRGGPAPRRPAR